MHRALALALARFSDSLNELDPILAFDSKGLTC